MKSISLNVCCIGILLCFLICPLFGQWEPDFRLTDNDSMSQFGALNTPVRCVATGYGTTVHDVHVVWVDNRDGNYEIYYRLSTNSGNTWETEQRFTDNSWFSYWPSISVVEDTVHVVWMDGEFSPDIYYKRFTDAGSSWSPDTQLTTESSQEGYPKISAVGNTLHIAWQDYRFGFDNPEIYYKRSTDNGITWEADLRVSSDTNYSGMPSISAYGPYVHIVWGDTRDGNWEIYYRRSTDSGVSWGLETRLTDASGISVNPSISAFGTYVHLVWEDRRDGPRNIYRKRSTNNGTAWDPDTQLTNDSNPQRDPCVCLNGNHVHIVWSVRPVANPEIYYTHSSDNGATWDPDTQLTNAPDTSQFCSVAARGPYVHIVWQDDRDGNREIYYKRDPTGSQGIETESNLVLNSTSQTYEPSPNPFLRSTAIPGHEEERFVVYNVEGRIAGNYQGSRIGKDLAPGVYFIRLQTGDKNIIRKIIKLK